MPPRRPKIEDPRKKPLGLEELQVMKNHSGRTRLPFESDWWLNLAYLSGRCNVGFDIQNGRLVEADELEPGDRTVHNLMMKITRYERAKVLKTAPVPTVLPSRDDEQDSMMARLLESYLGQVMWQWRFPRRLRTGTFWLVTCGNVFYKWYWDREHGVRFDVVPPFEVYPDPYATRFEDARWVIHERFVPVETAWDMYGDEPGCNHEALSPTSTQPVRPIEHMVYADVGVADNQNLEGVTLNEFWQWPNKSRPEGKHIVFTEAGIVLDRPFPFTHGRNPFTHAGHIERGNSKWYASVLDYVRELQRVINKREFMIGYNMAVSQGKWWVPPGLDLEADPDAEPGQILRGTGSGAPIGAKPEMIQVDSLPNWALNEPDRIKASMQDLAVQHEVSQGGVPGRVESGQAIQLLQETDDSVMKDTIHSQEEAIQDGFWMTLSLLKQYGKAKQLVRVYDKDGSIEVKELFTNKIDLDVQVRVQTTTSLPTSVAGKSDRILNYVQYEIVSPQEARSLLDLSSEDPNIDPTVEDRKRAYRENQRLKTNGHIHPFPPKWYHNHEVHIEEHRSFMNTNEFAMLSEETQQAFEFHVDTHRELLLEELNFEHMKQATLEGGLQPAAPPGGGPPPPAEPGGPPPPAPPDGQGPPEVD